MSTQSLNRREVIVGAAATGLLASCATTEPVPAAPALLSWEKLPTAPFPGKQDDIAFGSARRGWYGNGKGLLYRTDDGGNAWTQIWEQPGTFVRALGFIDEEVGILGNVGVGSFPGVTDTRPLYRTVDGGRTWTAISEIEGPVASGICAIEIQKRTIIDRGERAEQAVVHAAGRVGGPAHYLRSRDGGVSWTSRDLGKLTAAIFDVKFKDARTGFIAGTSNPDLKLAHGLILRTDDGGDTWNEVYRSRRLLETVWKLHFPSNRIGFGTVQNYDPDPAKTQRFIAATDDGGRSWHEVPLVADAKWRSFGVGFADAKLGWVGGTTGGLETRDGGRTWAPTNFGRAVNKIRFVGQGEKRRVFAIGLDVHRLSLS